MWWGLGANRTTCEGGNGQGTTSGTVGLGHYLDANLLMEPNRAWPPGRDGRWPFETTFIRDPPPTPSRTEYYP